jgi:hypothetical protein
MGTSGIGAAVGLGVGAAVGLGVGVYIGAAVGVLRLQDARKKITITARIFLTVDMVTSLHPTWS